MSQQKAISYALFGYNKARQDSCFDFNSYLRGLMINLRMNRLLYPDWVSVLHLDKSTYEGFSDFFHNIGVQIVICEPAPLCKAMLWRLKPCFEFDGGHHKYSHVICRDLDSPATYREVQAVTHWMNLNTAMHAITDSVSHNIPLMGGMIGIQPKYFTDRFNRDWDNFTNVGIDFSRKGSDQTFLNQVLYPVYGNKGSESIIQHYVLGHGDTFLSGYYNHIPDIEISIPYDLKESNQVCGHIGAAGYYPPVVSRFLFKYKDQFSDLIEAEKKHKDIFYWTENLSF